MKSCIYYEDLLTVPYKENGRDLSGMDCYGLAIECSKRHGAPVKDLVYPDIHVKESEFESYVSSVNVVPTNDPQPGDGIQAFLGSQLHIGFLLNKSEVIHMTFDGVRINRIEQFRKPKFFKVVKQ